MSTSRETAAVCTSVAKPGAAAVALRTRFRISDYGLRIGANTIVVGAALALWLTCSQVDAQSPLLQLFEDAAVAAQLGTVDQPDAHDPDAPPADSNYAPGPEAAKNSGAQDSAPPPTGEVLPPPQLQGTLPLVGSDAARDMQLSQNEDGLITLIVREKPLSQILALLAQTQGLNIVAGNDIDALISITLRDVPLEEALTAILSVANYTWVQRGNIILVTSLSEAARLSADVQGRQIQVFDLDFVSAKAMAETVTNLLSPVGTATIQASDPANNKMTQERIVVEDLPEPLARIAAFICQVDRPPRQVLIEAHVLQVNLDDTCRCGVNLSELVRIHNSTLSLKTTGLANSAAPQAFLATLEGGDLGGVIELLQTTTDTKTLGSPKLLAINEQEARLQVGEQLGFKVTTTTETSTMESVQFLDVGVVLSIIPRITRDNRVLLHVKPEVSKGEVNPETGLPEEETTEVETDIMLEDGQGMIIGGLIQETDSVTQQKVPYLGEVKGIGWLFRRSEVTKNRAEIIIALVPRIQPYDNEYQAYEQGELVRAGVPLFHGPLLRTYRPFDPILPDGKRVYRHLNPKKNGPHFPAGHPGPGPEYEVPPYPLPRQQFYGDGCEEHGVEEMPALRTPEMPSEAPPVPQGR
jgi:type II secretory pathway component GspD/PulD (secretin)